MTDRPLSGGRARLRLTARERRRNVSQFHEQISLTAQIVPDHWGRRAHRGNDRDPHPARLHRFNGAPQVGITAHDHGVIEAAGLFQKIYCQFDIHVSLDTPSS